MNIDHNHDNIENALKSEYALRFLKTTTGIVLVVGKCIGLTKASEAFSSYFRCDLRRLLRQDIQYYLQMMDVSSKSTTVHAVMSR